MAVLSECQAPQMMSGQSGRQVHVLPREQTVAPQVHVPMKVSKQQSQRAQALPSQPTVSPTLNGRPLSRDLQQEMCLMQPLLQEPRLRLSGSLRQGAKSMQLMTAKQLLLWAVKISQPQGSPMQLKVRIEPWLVLRVL